MAQQNAPIPDINQAAPSRRKARRSVRRWFADLPIARKLAFSFGLLVLFILGLVVLNYYTTQQIQQVLANRTNADFQLSVVLNMSANLDALRLYEREYLLKYPELGVEPARQTYSKLKQDEVSRFGLNLSALRAEQNPSTPQDREVLDILDVLQPAVSTYSLNFDQLLSAVSRRGFGSTGIEGSFVANAAALEELLNTISDTEGQVLLLQMRRAEKDWGLVKDPAAAQEVALYGQLLQNRMIALELDPNQEVAAINLVTQYLSSFSALVEQDRLIDSLQAQLDQSGQEMKQFTSQLAGIQRNKVAIADQEYDNIQGFSLPIGYGLQGLAIFLSLVFAIILSRAISRPLNLLTQASIMMSEGNLSVRTTVDSDDEIGQLSNIFNMVSLRLGSTLDALQQRLGDLTLASEVGQRISAFRNLDELLRQVVDLMRSRYNLYYAQVYLVDEKSRSLVLRAGTGAVGEELVRRGHRLVIGLGSLNGRAALEKTPVLVANTAESPTFLPNPLLPGTRSEMALPLLVGDRVVGVLDLQDTEPGKFNPEILPGFQALAAQLAVAIDNALVFNELLAERAEADTRLRQDTAASWQSFLDAVERAEKIGFAYTSGEILPLSSDVNVPGLADNFIRVPITVSGQEIGFLEFEAQTSQAGAVEVGMLEQVSEQISRQVESLRLLSEAQRYRHEAEEAARLLTQEGWETYVSEQTDGGLAFVYDRDRVKLLSQTPPERISSQPAAIRLPIQVRGEAIGALEIGSSDNSVNLDADMLGLINTILDRLGVHIEGLRLADQTRQALAEVQINEERIRSLVENAPEAIVIVDVETGLFTDPNENAAKLYGLSREELPKYGPAHLSPPVQPDGRSSMDAAMSYIGEALDGGLPVFEWMHRNAQGEDILCEIRLVRLPDPSKPLVRATVLDIRERKEAEKALRESRERFSIAVEGSNDGIWDWNIVTDDVFFSPRWKEMIGFEEHELTGGFADFEKLLHPEDHDWVMRAVSDYLAQKIPVYDIEFRFRHKNSSYRWIHARGTALRDADGSPLRMAGSHSDVTDRKIFEQELAKRALELETVAEVSTTASTALDTEYLLQQVVDLTKERFGLYHAHIYLVDEETETLVLTAGAGEVGRQMVSQGWRIPLGREQSLVARAARTRQGVIVNDVRVEIGFLPNPLLPDTRSELAVPLMAGDRVLGVLDVQSNEVNAFTDVDVRIQGTLGAQVGVALQNARLYAEQAATVARLQELDYLKSAFLANMSHELRTPLNSIIGFTEVILAGLDGPLTDTMEEDLSVIHKNGQHLLQLINEVLDMAKIEAGKMNLIFEMVDMNDIVADVVNTTGGLAQDKNLELLVEADSGDALKLEADYTRVRQVLLNLVANAVKFTNEGYIKVEARNLGEVIKVTVQDTGIGIPEEYLENIFESFSQVDTSTTRKVGGTGLGLPISRQLVELHSGRLWAESSGVPGEGSRFFMELPVHQPEKQQSPLD